MKSTKKENLKTQEKVTPTEDPNTNSTLKENPATVIAQSKGTIPKVGRFHKVSFKTFLTAYKPIYVISQKVMQGIDPFDTTVEFAYSEEQMEKECRAIYDNIKLPRRATKGSLGYDFFFPFGDTELRPGASIVIPTGIKVEIIDGWMLKLYPRSSMGFNYKIQLDNTVGIIDQDYFNNPSNEGHIFVKLTNDNREGLTAILGLGQKFCQGFFEMGGITIDDDIVDEERTGGLGSTD